MVNIYFPDEEVLEDDLYFVCYILERIARTIKQPKSYIVDKIGRDEFRHLLSVANVLHCDNHSKVEFDWINDYHLEKGNVDVTIVNPELVSEIPTTLQMGKVYTRLILSVLLPDEEYIDGIFKVYHHPICQVIDNYNGSAYYEPSYYITRAYLNDGNF